VNPSGKLPNTFPKSEADLPHPTVTMPPPESSHFNGPASPEQWAKGLPPFQVTYDEGLKVGYKWYDAEGKAPLFAFGHGLSFTTYVYSALRVESSTSPSTAASVSFTVKNTGARGGREIAQIYASLPASAGEPPKRLVAWDVVDLRPGESKAVRVPIDALSLSIFDTSTHAWRLPTGQYTIRVGGSSASLPLTTTLSLDR